ncbi:MAG: hypothetical protein HW412_648 [Bacteroidetes bacterium]|nr:hypothetical protein [Bacteroidota bacterium]
METESKTLGCPNCKEETKADAVRCKHSRSAKSEKAITMKNVISSLVMVVLLGKLVGCASSLEDQRQLLPEVTAAAAGLGFDVEYIEPQKFRDPGDITRVYFPVKFVCGEIETNDGFVPASYRTSINVQSLSKFKVKIGWRFVTIHKTIIGAQAEIPSYGSLVMDCDFIVNNLVSSGVAVGSFIEGFVLIEDLQHETTVRVAAVYSVLHKQLHELPDLVPVETATGFCKSDAKGGLIVTVKNKGEKAAPASTARITFKGFSPVDRFTKALAVGEQVDLEPVDIPVTTEEGTLTFVITVDIYNQIRETNEANNTVIGACKILL